MYDSPPERFFDAIETQDDGCKPMDYVGDEPRIWKTERWETGSSGEENEEKDANVREMIRCFEEEHRLFSIPNFWSASGDTGGLMWFRKKSRSLL